MKGSVSGGSIVGGDFDGQVWPMLPGPCWILRTISTEADSSGT